MTRQTTIAAWAGVALVYFLTCSRVLAPADSPEFVALMVRGGFAHAPGSPTTVLLYKLFAWLPLDPPFAASFATAIFGSAAIGLLYLACRAWGVPRTASVVAMVLVGLHSQVWLLHTHPEAFAVNDLFAAAILLFAAPLGPARGARRIAVLGLLAGVGLGAHQSLVLLAPVGLWGVWLGTRESQRAPLAVAGGALLFVAGFCVYATMLLWDSPVSFGRIDSLDSLVHHVLRMDYGTTSLSAAGTAGPTDQLMFWIVETFADSAVLGLVFLLVGLVSLKRQDRDAGWWALAATWVLCGPIFIAIFNLDLEGPKAEMVKRFHVLPMIIGTPFVALGVQWAQELPVAKSLKAAAAVGAMGLLLLTGSVRTSAAYSGALQDSLRNTLEGLPPRAVILGSGDHRYFGWQYLQEVEGLRPDVVTIEPSVLAQRWYIDRLRPRVGSELPYAGSRIDLRAVLDVLLATDRPVFIADRFAKDVLAERRIVPDGPAWRMLREGEPEPSAQELYDRTRTVFDGFVHHAAPPEYVRDAWGWSLFHSHTELWADVLARCEGAGAPCTEGARDVLERYPDL